MRRESDVQIDMMDTLQNSNNSDEDVVFLDLHQALEQSFKALELVILLLATLQQHLLHFVCDHMGEEEGSLTMTTAMAGKAIITTVMVLEYQEVSS